MWFFYVDLDFHLSIDRWYSSFTLSSRKIIDIFFAIIQNGSLRKDCDCFSGELF